MFMRKLFSLLKLCMSTLKSTSTLIYTSYKFHCSPWLILDVGAEQNNYKKKVGIHFFNIQIFSLDNTILLNLCDDGNVEECSTSTQMS